MPGSQYDGRPWVEDPYWQHIASAHQFALVSSFFVDKPHADMDVESYVNVSHGSGDALLCALTAFAACAHENSIASVPLAFWGFSAGGEYNYQFAAWRPERVIGFVVNKGGVYYTALTRYTTRRTPGLLILGDDDAQFRIETIRGLFAVNREAHALWALAPEPGVGHEVSCSKEMGGLYLRELIPLRLPPAPPIEVPGGGNEATESPAPVLRPLDERAGYIGDLSTFSFVPAAEAPATTDLTAFLPTLAIARAWQTFCRGEPRTGSH
jgi:hypothetical protein